MRKKTTGNKKQIRSSSKKEAREDFSFYIGIVLAIRTATFVFWIREAM